MSLYPNELKDKENIELKIFFAPKVFLLYSSFDCRHFIGTFYPIVGVINFSTIGAIIYGYFITMEMAETERANKKAPNFYEIFLNTQASLRQNFNALACFVLELFRHLHNLKTYESVLL